MKKVFLYPLVALLVLYSVAWFAASRIIESEVHTQLASLKQDGIIEEYSGDIEVSGFPFSFNIKFIHPRVKFKQAVSADALFDGVLAVNLNLFSSKIMAALNGDLHLKMLVHGQNFNLTTSSKNFSLGIQLQNSLVRTGIKLATSNGQQQLPISGGYLSLEDFSLTNKATNKILLYSEEMDLKLKLDGPSDNLSVNLYENIKNTEFQSEFNALSAAVRSIQPVRNALNQISANARDYFDVFSPDKFGRINHEMDLSFGTNKGGNRLNVDKFKLRDALQEVDLSGDFTFGETTKMAGNFSGKFSERWYRLAQVYAERLDIQSILPSESGHPSSSHSIFADIFRAISHFIRNAFIRGNRAAYVPQLHEMGRIDGDINLAYTQTPGGFFIEANKINVRTQAFGVQVNGRVNSSVRSTGDTYEIKAKLHNYSYIVDTTVSYINRIARNMQYNFIIGGKQLALSPAIANKIKLFVLEMSDNPNSSSNDLALTIINKDGGKYPQVGGYSSQEFGRAWNNFVFTVIFMEIAEKLDPVILKQLLQNPLSLAKNLPQDLGQTAKNITEGLLNIFGK